MTRGSNWQGAYATMDGDEFLYSAYINALIDGRPRKNDPFSGRDDHPSAPLPESTFSIQFIPPLVISTLAKACGASASTAFIGLAGVAGLLASLAVFYLITSITSDNHLSAVGTLFVLCFGTLAAGEGLFGVLLHTEISTVGFPFLRRYQPAATFFIFFLFCAFVWSALVNKQRTMTRLYAVLSGLALGVLIFSYLYLWTAAGAWVVCVLALWFYFRRSDRRTVLEVFVIVGVIAVFAFAVYASLLSNRAGNLDETQTLILTHRPDLFRLPELLAGSILGVLIWRLRRKDAKTEDPSLIFAASLALLPLVLFNQQVVTGRSMQPFHYQDFIANYVVLVSFILALSCLFKTVSRRALSMAAVLCLLWGTLEVLLPAQARYTSDTVNDEMVPVLRRLRFLAEQDGTVSGLRAQGKVPAVVLSPDSEVMRLLPTWTMQGTLLGLGGLDFGSARRNDQKVYTYLYFCGANGQSLRNLLHEQSKDGFMNYYARSAIFGHERVLPKLSLNFHPIQVDEIENSVHSYETYINSFSREEALKHPISYVLVRADDGFDFSRIDLWYERDEGERLGDYVLFRLKSRVNDAGVAELFSYS